MADVSNGGQSKIRFSRDAKAICLVIDRDNKARLEYCTVIRPLWWEHDLFLVVEETCVHSTMRYLFADLQGLPPGPIQLGDIRSEVVEKSRRHSTSSFSLRNPL
jgi:hypothetical protein